MVRAGGRGVGRRGLGGKGWIREASWVRVQGPALSVTGQRLLASKNCLEVMMMMGVEWEEQLGMIFFFPFERINKQGREGN